MSLVLLLPGAVGLAVGLAGLRLMSRRSVSLRALRAIQEGRDPRPSFERDIAERVAELERLGLASSCGDGELAVTPFGRLVLTVVGPLRRLLGVWR